MEPIVTARRIAVLLLVGSIPAFAQSTLPALGPTAASSSTPSPGPAVAPASAPSPAPTMRPGRLAQVAYLQGQLSIAADNSSLNQILREISRQTGMTITGGVTDERVFGKYGPGPPSEILASLLDGTGSNMLLRESASNVPTELILTPREGGVTPPNPNAPGFDDDRADDRDPRTLQNRNPAPLSGAVRIAPQLSRGALTSHGEDPGASRSPMFAPVPSTFPSNGQSTTPSTDAPQSPNGVPTPQQIYQQLQQLQRSQPQP